ncbi:MAG: hypothetical protein OIF32_12550 [Campylobacterales bacterium]|nr:hypothetical protein [Campylobacterales bacterium]
MSSINISIDFQDKTSVKKGLKNFRDTLDKFYKKKYSMEEDEIYIYSKDTLIKKSEFSKYFTCQNIYGEGYKIDLEEFIEPNIHYSILSQVYLFEKALEYGYTKKLLKICKLLLKYIKKKGDFHNVWYSDVTYFGFYLLFTLAYNKPKYTYLMSKYFTSDWDDQSMTLHQFFYMVYEKHGASDDIINAISYLVYGENLYDFGFLNPVYPLGEDKEGRYIFKEKRRFFNLLKKDKNLYEKLKLYILKNTPKYNDYLYDYDDVHVIEKYYGAIAGINYLNEEKFEEFKKEKIHGAVISKDIEELKHKIDAIIDNQEE